MRKKKKLRIATRSSPLALKQAEWVKRLLRKIEPRLVISLVKIQTSGDRFLEVPLTQRGGKGLFVKEIEEALLHGKADLAVHSMKDLPAEIPAGLALSAFPKREDPRDVVVFSRGDVPKKLLSHALDNLPHGATIGTTSVRRQSVLRHLRPDLEFVSLRGNVGTRLRKLDEKNSTMDAIVLAAAGLKRLGLSRKAHLYLPADLMVPAVGQGCLAIETRQNDPWTNQWVEPLNHPETAVVARCERAFLQRLEASCLVPVGAYGSLQGRKMRLHGFISSLDGRSWVEGKVIGRVDKPEALGVKLAERLLQGGGKEILQVLRETDA